MHIILQNAPYYYEISPRHGIYFQCLIFSSFITFPLLDTLQFIYLFIFLKGFFVSYLFSFFKEIHVLLFIYLFMTVLSLRFCARAFSSWGKWGPLFIAVRGPLTIVASRCRAQAPNAQAQ